MSKPDSTAVMKLSFSTGEGGRKAGDCETIAELKRAQDRLRALPNNGGPYLNASKSIKAIDDFISYRLRC